MFDDFAALRPLKTAAELLAAKSDWPRLYDLQALESTSVPVASATYYDDMYVDHNCAQVLAQTTQCHWVLLLISTPSFSDHCKEICIDRLAGCESVCMHHPIRLRAVQPSASNSNLMTGGWCGGVEYQVNLLELGAVHVRPMVHKNLLQVERDSSFYASLLTIHLG